MWEEVTCNRQCYIGHLSVIQINSHYSKIFDRMVLLLSNENHVLQSTVSLKSNQLFSDLALKSCVIKSLFFSFLLKASYQTCLCTDSLSLTRRMRREQPKRSCVCRTRINWTRKVSPKANCQVRGSPLVTPALVFTSLFSFRTRLWVLCCDSS